MEHNAPGFNSTGTIVLKSIVQGSALDDKVSDSEWFQNFMIAWDAGLMNKWNGFAFGWAKMNELRKLISTGDFIFQVKTSYDIDDSPKFTGWIELIRNGEKERSLLYKKIDDKTKGYNQEDLFRILMKRHSDFKEEDVKYMISTLSDPMQQKLRGLLPSRKFGI